MSAAPQQARTEIAQASRVSLIERFAARFQVEPVVLARTLKQTAFKQRGDREISNEQLCALLIVAEQYGLNPWTKEIYAFDDGRGGIVPVVGVDGWSRIINEHPALDGISFTCGPLLEATAERAAPYAWIECVIHRKDREHPIAVREDFDECYRPPSVKREGGVVRGPWQTHPKRFLRHKALIQCARIAFGFVGIHDEDEAQRIIEGEIVRAETVVQRGPESVAGAADLNASVRTPEHEGRAEPESDAVLDQRDVDLPADLRDDVPGLDDPPY